MTLLDAHRVKLSNYDPRTGPHLFDLNSDYAGISITDQMRRGHDIIVEALRENIIGPDKPLLIIGAGVAGMMAAATAATADVPTRVIEKEKLMFSVQANCPSRWVCPTQYSWPHEGWNNGVYPPRKSDMPFAWRRGLAAVEARTVREIIEPLLDANDQLKVIIGTEFQGYSLTKDYRDQWCVVPLLDVTPKDSKFPRSFYMALACTGFGTENTVVKRSGSAAPATDFTGPIFWELDQYEEDNPPLGIHSDKPNVLISGSGDGALQDFLRIATTVDAARVAGTRSARRASSAAALYSLAFEHLPSIRRRITRRIKDVEQRYQVDLTGPNSHHPDREIRTLNACCVNGEAQLEHLTIINELCREATAWRRVTDALDRVVKDLRHEINIKVLYPCFHISPYYGLNRFLTLLVVAYAYQRYPDVQLLYPGVMVTGVMGIGRHAPPDTCQRGGYCHGKEHRVLCAPADCLTLGSGSVKVEDEFEGNPYNAVIIRHGILKQTRAEVLSELRLTKGAT